MNIDVEIAKKHILKHGILAFQTDTIMGLGVNGLDKLAVKNLFKLKNRPYEKPLYILCYSMDQIFKYTLSIPDYALKLMEKYFPGAITFIFYSTEEVWTSPIEKGKTVGVRIPNLKPLLELLAYIDLPILNTSANISGEQSIEKEEDLYTLLSNSILYVPFEYNISMSNIPSTVVDCTGDKPVILRKGAVDI